MGEEVQWTSKERVDVPDMKAMGSVQTSEFRRHMRGVMFGLDNFNAVVKGFEVEPAAPVSSRIVVRLDRSADAVPFQETSYALGGQNLGGGTVDNGVLLGGKNSADEFEGPAQLILDFSGQPVAAYTVEMRYNATPGDKDNRAFWDEVANSEFVKSTDTRIKPLWELRFQGPASPEWTPLAEVNWDGATVDLVDITDKRVFVHEGFAAIGFDFASQSSPFSFDFDRSPDRGTFGVTTGGVYLHLAALNRQILDLKGQSDAGFFNWYDRVFKAPGEVGFPATQTKSLRTVDVVSYTIGDGNTEFGDFNGPSGFEDCMQHIETNQATIPFRVKIVIKNRVTGPQGLVLGTPVVLTDKHLEIIGGPGGVGSVPTAADPVLGLGAPIIFMNNPAFSVGILLTGNCSLTIKNCNFFNGFLSQTQSNMFLVEGPVIADNSFFRGYATGVNEFVFQCRSDGLQIQNCEIEGVCNIGGTRDIAAPMGGQVRNTRFEETILRLRSTVFTAGVTLLDVLEIRAANLAFEECTFSSRDLSLHTPDAFGMIDCRGTLGVRFDNCTYEHSADEDCIRLGTLPTTTFGLATNDLTVRDGLFGMRADNTHAFGLGAGGTDGTGHHIFSRSPAMTVAGEIVNGVNVEGCRFFGSTNQSPDAAAVAMFSPKNVWIRKSRFTLWFPPLVAAANAHIILPDEGAGFDGRNVWIEKNFFGEWGSTGHPFMSCVAAFALEGLHVNSNSFDRRNAITGVVSPHLGEALRLDSIVRSEVTNNEFIAFRNPSSPILSNTAITMFNGISAVNFESNVFAFCGGDNIHMDQLGAPFIDKCSFQNNFFQVGVDDTQFNSAIFIDLGVGDQCHYYDNRWDYSDVAPVKTAIHMGSNTNFVLSGNWFDGGNVLKSGGNTDGVGYPEVSTVAGNPQDRHNVFAGYL